MGSDTSSSATEHKTGSPGQGGVVAAFVEEACKIMVVYWVVWRRPEFDERMTYSPVMRLVPVERQYAVSRMTPMSRYWSLALDQGSLGRIVSKYVKTIGTEKFFELCSPQSETVAKSTGVRR